MALPRLNEPGSKWMLIWFISWVVSMVAGISIGEVRERNRVEQIRQIVSEQFYRNWDAKMRRP